MNNDFYYLIVFFFVFVSLLSDCLILIFVCCYV